jgi:hypothetical protein
MSGENQIPLQQVFTNTVSAMLNKIGLNRQLMVDKETYRLYVHDGVTKGGHAVAKVGDPTIDIRAIPFKGPDPAVGETWVMGEWPSDDDPLVKFPAYVAGAYAEYELTADDIANKTATKGLVSGADLNALGGVQASVYELTADDIANETETKGLVSGADLEGLGGSGAVGGAGAFKSWTHTEPYRKVVTFGAGSGNVLQDFAINPVTRQLVVTQITNGDLLVNTFDEGVDTYSRSRTYANRGHGQGVSFELDGAENFIWLGGDDAAGNVVHRLNHGDDSIDVYPVNFDLSKAGTYGGNITPKIDASGEFMIIRVTDQNDDVDYLFVYNFIDIKTDSSSAIASVVFSIDLEQNTTDMFFQGLAATSDTITVLTGNTELGSAQLLYTYSYDGNVISKHNLSLGSEFAVSEGTRQEVEGLAYYPNGTGEQKLITSVMTGQSGANIKRMYFIKNGPVASTRVGSGVQEINITLTYNGTTWVRQEDLYKQDCESVIQTTPSVGEGLTVKLAFPISKIRSFTAFGNSTFMSRGLIVGYKDNIEVTDEIELRIYDLLNPSATPAADRIPSNSARIVSGSKISIVINYEYDFGIVAKAM